MYLNICPYVLEHRITIPFISCWNLSHSGIHPVLWFVQCAYCSKAFFNASFLQAHLARRHGESSRSQIPSQPEPMPTDQPSQNPELIRQLEELRVKLSMTESQLVEERNRRNEKQQTVR